MSGTGNQGSGDVEKTVNALRDETLKYSKDAHDWYDRESEKKGFRASFIRVAAIVCFGLAGAIPLLIASGIIHFIGELLPIALRGKIVVAQLGYVFAAFATALLGFDKFMGYSTGWTRYRLAQIDLDRCTREFEGNWAIATANIDDDEKNSGKKRLELLKTFLLAVTDIVGAETRQWATEFQSSIATLDKAAKDAQDNNRPGAIAITVERATGVEAEVALCVDGQERAGGIGNVIVANAVSPGLHQVKIRGKKSGKDVENQAMITVPAGAAATLAMKLE